MERILLINNKSFFDNHNIKTINNPNDIPNSNSILFIGSHTNSIDSLDHIKKYFEVISKKPYTYIIIVGKGDGTLYLDRIPINIKYIFATNTDYYHPIIKFLPMGSDFRSISSFKKSDINKANINKANINNKERNILCYCNFSLDTHKSRINIFNYIKNKSFITFESMGTFLKYSISRDTFFERLGNSKFTICPRGNARDTFRFYDSIYSGSIPIVVREQFHNLKLFDNIPILFLNHELDFEDLTEEFLEKKYIELMPKVKNYYESLDFNEMIKEISKLIHN
jgi:hypothetical protein